MTDYQTLSDHPKLTHPPLVGVAFEMEFSSQIEINEAIAHIRADLEEDFPRIAKRVTHNIEAESPIDDLQNSQIIVNSVAPSDNEPAFKLFSNDHARELQLGSGFFRFSVGEDYEGWKYFLFVLNSLLSSHNDSAKVVTYKSFKLFYENILPWDHDNTTSMFRDWLLPGPPDIKDFEKIAALEQKIVLQFPDGYQEIVLNAPEYDFEEQALRVKFSIEHYLIFEIEQEAILSNLNEWLETAHERIYQTFIKSLRPDFLEGLS